MARTTKSKTKPAKRQYKRRTVEHAKPPEVAGATGPTQTKVSDVIYFLSDDVTRLWEAIDALEKRLNLALQPEQSSAGEAAMMDCAPPAPTTDSCPLVFMGFGLSSRIMAATNAIRYLERRVQL